jgi:hypothetical protein
MTSSCSRTIATHTIVSFATLILAGCEHTNDCFDLRREMPVIELVDRVGAPGIPFYDTVLSFATGYERYPRCSDFDPMFPGARISVSNVGVGSERSICTLMTADAQIGTVSVPFDLPLEDSMLDRATLFYSSELSLDGGHLLLGASSAQFGECSGYWLVVASSGLDTDSGNPYTDPGEGSLPPWTVYRMFRPSDDPGCVDREPCVDGFTARMVMPP